MIKTDASFLLVQ